MLAAVPERRAHGRQRHAGDSLQEVDGKLYAAAGQQGYVRYRVDRQEASRAMKRSTRSTAASAIRRLWSFTAARTITAETRRSFFALCADGHWRIVAAEP